MDAELGTLRRISAILEWKNQLQEAGKKIQEEEKLLRSQTLSTKEYCERFGISRPTLNKRRSLGLVTCINVGGEKRYLLPEEGESNG